jgi:hypothetical protein
LSKRQKQKHDGAAGSTALPEEAHPPGTEDRIYGQWLKLKKVHVSLRGIGISVSDEGERTPTNVVILEDPAVKSICPLCDEYLQTDLTQADAATDLDGMSVQVRALHMTVDNKVPDWKNEVQDEIPVLLLRIRTSGL